MHAKQTNCVQVKPPLVSAGSSDLRSWKANPLGTRAWNKRTSRTLIFVDMILPVRSILY